MKPKPIRIILADDHEIFRDGFTNLIDMQPGIELVAEAADGEQLIRVTQKFLPDVVLTDIKMPVMDGIEATRDIAKKFPHIGIIALSMFNDDDLLFDMMEAGAKGYLLKNAQKEEVISAINSVNKNAQYFCNDTQLKLAKLNFKNRRNNHDLNEREIEIMKLICKEFSNKEIGEIISLSSRTIEGHRERILQKTQSRNTVGIVRFAYKHKIISTET